MAGCWLEHTLQGEALDVAVRSSLMRLLAVSDAPNAPTSPKPGWHCALDVPDVPAHGLALDEDAKELLGGARARQQGGVLCAVVCGDQGLARRLQCGAHTVVRAVPRVGHVGNLGGGVLVPPTEPPFSVFVESKSIA
eukprot:352468-Chlamydomonas_euryale.AAC.4